MKSVNPIDDAFLRKLNEIVEEHISNEKFGANDLAKYAGISRSHIHRRLKSITSQTVSHFIRDIRLKKSIGLLRQSDLSISEIAYKVGFSSPAYFNRCFHEEFGYPPGEVRKHPGSYPEVSDNKTERLSGKDTGSISGKDWIYRNRNIIAVLVFFIFLVFPAYIVYDVFFNKNPATPAYDKSLTFLPFRDLIPGRENQYFADAATEDILNRKAQNSEAYNNYLRGRFLLNKANSEQRFDTDRKSLISSLDYFNRTIEADTNFVLAYAGLATAWFNLAAWGWYQPYSEGIRNAWKYTVLALKKDPDCYQAQTIKAACLIWPERNFADGRKEIQYALHLNPDYSFAHQIYAQLLMITGPIEEARTQINQCLALEPYFWIIHNLNAWISYFEGNYREAIQACLLARSLKSDFPENGWLMFLNYAKLEEGQLAGVELKEIARPFYPDKNTSEEIDRAFASKGIEGLFLWLVQVNKNNPANTPGLNGHPFFLAWWYALLGDKENTLYWLKKNMESPSRLYIYFNLIAQNPDFDFLRDDPRFLGIIDETGLSPFHHRKPR